MNIETRPNTQMPAGKARNVPNADGNDGCVFEDDVFMPGTIPGGKLLNGSGYYHLRNVIRVKKQ